MLYLMQQNAWIDERVFFFWVVRVLKPYVKLAPEHVISIIFLNFYRCNIMGYVPTTVAEWLDQ